VVKEDRRQEAVIRELALPFDYTQGKLPAHLGHKLRMKKIRELPRTN
jgi:hypothetical protein